MPRSDRPSRATALLKSSLLVLPIALAGCGGNSGGAQAGSEGDATSVAVGGGSGQSAPTTPGAPATADAPAADPAATPGVCLPSTAPVVPTRFGTVMPPADPKLAGVAHKFFTITVRDAQTNLPIAGVRLNMVSKQIYITDDNGVVAFYEPGLMDRDVWFTPSRDGYTVAADALGVRGARVHALEGGAATIVMTASGTAPAMSMGNLQSRLAAANVPGKEQCMAIRVYDQQTLRGVPLVALQFPADEQISDSQGIVAYCNPDKMGALTVALSSHGYTAKSAAVQAVPGGTAQIALQRNNVAERLYRTTGQGVYRDSLLLGLTIPVQNGALKSQVVGQDSVIAAVYKNQIFWSWGDTDNLSYALGTFTTPGGTSLLPEAGGLDADFGVDFSYLGNPAGFVQGAVPGIAPTARPTWIGAMVALPDSAGNERLFASFIKPDSSLAPLKKGLVKFDDDAGIFKAVIEDYPLSGDSSFPDGGQSFKFDSPAGQYAYFSGGTLRIPAKAEAIVDRSTYEVYTPFLDGQTSQLDRVGNALQYQWRKGGAGVRLVGAAIANAKLDTAQALDGHLRNVADAAGIEMAATSITWNEYRGRFVMIGQQKYGSPSGLGEIWYAEADTPMGPWVDARKIVSHNDYTFYNPYTHPYLSRDKGKTVYFEGTYTTTFSSAAVATPRYDYNQIMYRIDVDDAKLLLPVPIYDQGGATADRFSAKQGVAPGSAALAAPFLALDRASADTTPVGWSGPACDASRRLISGAAVVDPLFYAAPSSAAPPLKSMVALYEYNHADGRHLYLVDAAQAPAGFVRAAAPLAWVWVNPIAVKLPVGEFRGNLVVNAGADQCVARSASATTASVTLNAAASRKGAGGAVSYRWQLPASQASAAQCVSVTGATATVQLAPGTHRIVLEGTDAAGNISSDALVVQVR